MTDADRLVVVWRVNEHCDLACRYCEYNRRLRRPRRQADPRSVLALAPALREYATASGRAVLVSFLGGEPLLWPPLRDVLHALKHDYGLQTGITTNGTRLTNPATRAWLARDCDEVTVSVDGSAAWHDYCRGRAGLYADLEGAVRQLRGPLLRANTVLMRANVFALGGLCAALAEWGIQEVTVNALGGTPGDPFFDQQRLLPEQAAWLRQAWPALQAEAAAHGVRLRGHPRYIERLARAARGAPWPVDDCAPGRRLLFVEVDGQAAPCAFTTGAYGVPVASLRSGAGVAALPARLGAMRAARPHPVCADCPSPHVFGKFEGGDRTHGD